MNKESLIILISEMDGCPLDHNMGFIVGYSTELLAKYSSTDEDIP